MNNRTLLLCLLLCVTGCVVQTPRPVPHCLLITVEGDTRPVSRQSTVAVGRSPLFPHAWNVYVDGVPVYRPCTEHTALRVATRVRLWLQTEHGPLDLRGIDP